MQTQAREAQFKKWGTDWVSPYQGMEKCSENKNKKLQS